MDRQCRLCFHHRTHANQTNTPRPRKQWQKTFNVTIASLRVGIEHCIAQLKNWKILKTGYRGPLHELPNIIQTITKLELYRLSW